MSEKTYKVSAPVGVSVLPKEVMTERDLRDYAKQQIQEPEQAETWGEKFDKDPIESVAEWLRNTGYQIEEL